MPVTPDRPSPDQAEMALKRLAEAWGLGPYDALALMGASGRDLSALVWTDDQLLRITYLVELEKALIELNPKFGIPHWIATPKPGPFFEGNSPLQMMTATTRDLAVLLSLEHWLKRSCADRWLTARLKQRETRLVGYGLLPVGRNHSAVV